MKKIVFPILSAVLMLMAACDKDVAITNIMLEPITLTLNVGEAESLKVSIEPANATNKSVTWNSDKPTIAMVNDDGEVTALAIGTTTITVSTDDSKHTAICSITVIKKADGISLDKNVLTLGVDETESLTVIFEPADVTDKHVTWSSNEPTIAMVNDDGEVTALVPGTATITVSTDGGKHTAICSVTVIKKVTDVSLDKSVLTLEKDETETLTATVSPDDATDKYVTWTSSDPSVAMVGNGIVHAVGIGTATITAITRDSEQTANCIVTVPGVMFEQSELTLDIGETKILSATIVPAGEEVTWISSDPSVAMVSKGVVFAKAAGIVTISVSTNDGKYKATCIVAVNPMTMTTSKFGEVTIYLAGSGTFTINWGDGLEIETHTLHAYSDNNWAFSHSEYGYTHSYSNASSRSIVITGENITHLDCTKNQLTSLDVSNNTELIVLYCYINQIRSLDVSKNTKLETLVCFTNQLTSLDVSNNTALKTLQCNDNQIKSLDVSKNAVLIILDCYYNQLTSLDVSKNTVLENLVCNHNQLDGLDVSKNTALTLLYCDDNKITSLDVSKNTALEFLHCGKNQLTSLDVNKNIWLRYLACDNNQLTGLDLSNTTVLFGLICYNNQLDAAALNVLFGTLHNVSIETDTKKISIGGNPGTNGCDRDIATNKGWEVSDY